jgi:hypothetical protein
MSPIVDDAGAPPAGNRVPQIADRHDRVAIGDLVSPGGGNPNLRGQSPATRGLRARRGVRIPAATGHPTAELRNPRKAGATEKRGTDPLSGIAGLIAARPAFADSRVFGTDRDDDERSEPAERPGAREWEVRSEARAATRFHFRTGVTRTSGRGWLCPISVVLGRAVTPYCMAALVAKQERGDARVASNYRCKFARGSGSRG